MPSLDDNLTLCNPRQSSGQDPNKAVLVRTPKPTHLPPNHVLIHVDRFGFSTNNITYQGLGEVPHFQYYEVHPAPTAAGVSPKTHGLIPVWGFGTVVASTHPKIIPGERVYGYLAPTRYLLLPVSPADVNIHSFYVPRPHLPADRRPYNQIQRCAADAQYDPSPLAEDYTMLYRPLFWTSFWCEDWLNSTDYRGGADRILISSASSKTAFCLAYLVRQRGGGRTVVGLTSARNVAFTRGLGLYDDVRAYDAPWPPAAARERWIYVDVAGNDALNARVAAHLGTARVAGVQLGMTNLAPDAAGAGQQWATNTFEGGTVEPGRMEQFFMPEWLAVRKRQLSVAEISRMQVKAWNDLMRDCGKWVALERVYGGDAVKKAYEEVANGGLGPDKGQIWSLWDKDAGAARSRM
ncbi:hypothetical protein PLICRDRAFT_54851 [Plicaturopsis crispa FD-325 SS-3]|nr:hypothetical protein PLICRDRAFT_54851 [Plicaturopsis crispa FD-325 SS-3]